MNKMKHIWASCAVLLLVALYVTDGSMNPSKPALRSRRMVGGLLAPIVPWHAMVFLSNDILEGGYGGGALIADRWVLTAGSNVYVSSDTQRSSPIIPKVYLGITSLSQANRSTEHVVEEVIPHPGINLTGINLENNLALIKLKRPVVMSDRIAPIPLPENDENFDNASVGAIAGWGWGVHLEQLSSLKYHILPLLPSCGDEYDEVLRFNKTLTFCTGPNKYGNNVCDKDAGGALAVVDKRTGDVYAAGILSFDSVCRIRSNAVYTNLKPYLPWIQKHVRGDTVMSAAHRNVSMSKMLQWAS